MTFRGKFLRLVVNTKQTAWINYTDEDELAQPSTEYSPGLLSKQETFLQLSVV
jgi:hypothetical protein